MAAGTHSSRHRTTYNWGYAGVPKRSSNGAVALAFCLPLALGGIYTAMCASAKRMVGV